MKDFETIDWQKNYLIHTIFFNIPIKIFLQKEYHYY